MRALILIVCVLPIAFLLSCSPLSRVDQSNLESVAAFYYGSKSAKPPTGDETYPLLSEKSQAQIGQAQWAKLVSSQPQLNPDSVTVLRQAEQQGATYGLVSVSWKSKDGKTRDINTETWILEKDKWRRLALPKTSEEASKAFQNGDFTAAETKVQEWLKDDPFSLEAYHLLAFSRMRNGESNLSDIVRAVLAINKDDTTANFLAVTCTDDPEIAKTFLKNLEGTFDHSQAAQNLAMKYSDSQKRLEFLNSEPTDITFDMMKVQCYGVLSKYKDALAILSKDSFTTDLRSTLDGQDPSYATTWAATMGKVAHFAGNDKLARVWLDYGVSRDPNAPDIKELSDLVGGNQ